MNSHPVLIVLAIAVAVLEMVLGIIIGPQVLGLAPAEGLLGWLGGKLGLAALFFMAGMELDLERVRGRPLTLAIRGWFCRSFWGSWWPLCFTCCRSCTRR